LLNFDNKLPVNVLKTLILQKLKKQREPQIIELEKIIVQQYKEGKVISSKAHLGILAFMELLKHQNIDV
jgi:hypothetical protein